MSDLLASLELELQQLQANYLKLSGGKTQCIVGKECEPSDDIKQAEGAMQALSDLVRCLKKITPNHINDEMLDNCIHKVVTQWSKLSEISETWVVYKRAGLEQIEKYRQK